jgi:hypothetical protein
MLSVAFPPPAPAQELAAEENATAVPARSARLRNATAALRDAYYTMRLGSKASTIVGECG